MISTRCIKTALMSLALTTPALMDSVPNVNGLKLTMRLKDEGELHPMQLQTSASSDPEKQEPQIIENLIHWFKGTHTAKAMPVVVDEDEEDPLTGSEDATKLVLLEDELRQLDTELVLLEDELNRLKTEQLLFNTFHKDHSTDHYKSVALEFEEGKAITSKEVTTLRLKRNVVLAQKENAESKSRK